MDEMKNISKAGYGLLKFVQAVLKYCDTYRDVKPKQDRVEFLKHDLEEKAKVLEFLRLDIESLEAELNALNVKYEASLELRQKYNDELAISEKRLNAADRLVTDLMSEKTRWLDELKRLGDDKETVVGTCLLSASFMAYLGAFSFDFRRVMIDNWHEDITSRHIPMVTPFRIDQNLCNDVEISAWASEGLPPDELSVQNGLLTVRASRFPLCIDPQQQALAWIKKREAYNNLKVLSFNDSDFLKQLEMSVKYGSPVLFQDVDDYIDPVIGNLLEKNFKVQSGQLFVVLGGKDVEVDPNFRMYLTTKISNPVLDPSIYAKALVINYSVTLDGLEDQLLSVVVREERRDLEEQREMLIEETSINKNLLSTLEDSLLRELSNSSDNILDNEDLISTLEKTKSKAAEVTEKLAIAAETSQSIEVARNGYREAAQRGAQLFFVLSEMAVVDVMYQYSLSSFLTVFVGALKKAMPDFETEKRLENIITSLTKSAYDYGSSGLFERHKLLFSFQIAAKLEMAKGTITQTELDFFIKGSVSLEQAPPCPAKWMSETSWKDLTALAEHFPGGFDNLGQHFGDNMADWQDWYDMEAPESQPSPIEESQPLHSFHKMMLLRCFRVDRVVRAMNNYISETMGEEFITPPVVNFEKLSKETEPNIPIIVMLSPGSDPTDELLKLSDKKGRLEYFKYISLGQGQEEKAWALLDDAIKHGHWLVLQNGHLLIPFMRKLDKMLDGVEEFHKQFRLWITTDPTGNFPIGLLQKSLKVVTEPPNGIKLNLRSTFFKLQPEAMDSCQHEAFKPLVYVLAFFNAVVLERRKYDKLGFNVSYDFNESDFNVCFDILSTYLSRTERVPWNTLKYLIGEVRKR